MPQVQLALASLADGPVKLDLDGTPVVVVGTPEGVAAFEDRCPHAGWRLSDDELVDGHLECPGHGWLFDAASGACVDVPAYRLRALEVTLEGDTVTVHAREASRRTEDGPRC